VPSFAGGANQEIWEDDGAQSVLGWATAMSTGPANEADQTLAFLISQDNSGFFSDGPSIDAMTGELTYTVADDEEGAATLTIRIQDDGGTANGGVDTSAAQVMILTVNATNDAPMIGLTDGWVIGSPGLHATGPYDLYGSGMDDVDTRVGDASESMTMILEVALFAEHGTLSLPNAAGVTFLVGDGTDDQVLAFEGEQADLNAALSHIEYRPDQFFGGFDRVFGHIDDRGWYGDGGPLDDDDMSVVEVKVPLGSATEFDFFGLSSVDAVRCSIDGRVAAGDDLVVGQFQSAQDLSLGSEQDVLVSGGSIEAIEGLVHNGGAVYGTSANIENSVGFANSSQEPREDDGVIDFAHANGDLEYRALSWGLAAPTGTAELSFNVLTLAGDGRELNVFSVDHADLQQASLVSVQVPPGSFALLNINGGVIEHSSFGVDISGIDARSVLFNFYEATSVDVSGTTFSGSLLAPQADIAIAMLVVSGNVVGENISFADGSTEGKLLAGEPWENTPWVMMMADEDGEDQPGYTFTFEPSDAEQDVTFQLTDAGELEVLADGYPTIRYRTDRITRLVVLDREGMSHLQISDKIEFAYELAGVGPVAYDDSASLEGSKSVQVNVLSNDIAGPAPLDLSSVEIVTQPQYGTVKVDAATGVVSYQQMRAQPGVVTSDVFWYTVRDGLSNVSTARRVRIQL
jgi:choice-of-anchor A domain-containing protein